MRLVAGFTLVHQGFIGLQGEPSFGRLIVSVLAAAAGMLLLAGLLTPVAGALAVGVELWCVFSARFSQTGDPLTYILLMTLGLAVALVGPGAWSVDARLFGWKRIDIPNRRAGRPYP
jgi:putative oxidoreductase